MPRISKRVAPSLTMPRPYWFAYAEIESSRTIESGRSSDRE